MSCEIFYAAHEQAGWKWRHIHEDGRVKESKETYALYYECVCAARASGYEPPIRCK